MAASRYSITDIIWHVLRSRLMLKKSIALATYTTIIAFIVVWAVCPPHFTETSDDAVMASFAYGYGGSPTAYLLFVNYFLGLCIKSCYLIMPCIRWYTVFQLITLFFSLLAIIYVMYNVQGIKCGVPLVLLLLFSFGFDLISSLQFTKTAGAAIVAGFILIYWSILNNRRSIHWVIGCALIIIGSMYRILTLPMLAIPFLPIFVLLFKDKYGNRDYKSMRNLLVCFVIIASVGIGLRIVHKSIYKANDGWNEASTYNVIRAQLIDNGFPEYDENIALYDSLNISKNDYILYSRLACYGDPDLYTPDVMRQLVEAKKSPTISLAFFAEAFGTLWSGLTSYVYFYSTLLCFAIVIICKVRTESIVVAVYELAAFVALQFYFYYSGRYLQGRVDCIYFLALITIFTCLHSYNIKKVLNSELIVICLCVVYIFCAIDIDERTLKYQEDVRNSSSAFFDEIANDYEHLYLYVANWPALPNKIYNAFDINDCFFTNNSAPLGTWRYNTPPTKAVLSRWSVHNPYKDIINRDDVYIVFGNDIGKKQVLKHIHEHYNQFARYEKVKVINHRYNIYRLVA